MTHHHHPGETHPAANVAPSMLRASALQRLMLAGICAVLLWLAVFWVVTS